MNSKNSFKIEIEEVTKRRSCTQPPNRRKQPTLSTFFLFVLQLLLFTVVATEQGLAQPNNGGGPPRAAAVSAYAEDALCSLCTGPVLPPGAAALRAPSMAVVADKPGKSCITATQGYQLFDLALTVLTDGYATMSVRQLPCGDSTATPPELTSMVVNLETGKEADKKPGVYLPKPDSLERSFLVSLPEEPKAAFEACEVAVTNLLGASSLEARAMVLECPSNDTLISRSASSSRVNGDGGVVGQVTGGLKCGAKHAWSGIKCGARYMWSATKFCGRWLGPAVTVGTVACQVPEITKKCLKADVEGVAGAGIQLSVECVSFGFIGYDPKTGRPYLWDPPGESKGQCKIKIEEYADKCVSSSVDYDGCAENECCMFDNWSRPDTQPKTQACYGTPKNVQYEIGLCRPCRYRKTPTQH